MSNLFGKRLKDLRIRQGKKAYQIAHLIGVSQGYFSQIENGTRTNVSKDILLKIAEALGIALDELLSDSRDEVIHVVGKENVENCQSCGAKDKEIFELREERDYLRKQVDALIGKLPDAKPSPGAAPACGAHGGDLKERRRA